MYERRVTHIRTNEAGDIIALTNSSAWGSVSTTAAMFHINYNMYRYYVAEEEYRSYIRVKHKECHKIVTTEENRASANHLHNLPS